MAVREIKTSITLDGEQQFRQAIAAANKELRVSEAELKAVASAYDLNGDKMQMLANKQRILGKEITVQENTVSSLKARMKEAERVYEEAGKSVDKFRAELEKANASGNKSDIDQATKDVERAERAYAEARKQLQNYQIETSNATTKLNQMRKTQQATDREIEEFGRDSIKVGRQIRDGIGDSAEAAEKDVRGLVKVLQNDLSSIRASTTFTAIGSLWDMATDAYSAVDGFVQSTMDYRRQLSYLEMNAEESGFGFDVVKDKLIETQAMTADASSAMEGLSNLLQIEGLSEEQLTRAMEGLLGASIKWQETLKFESLADSLQETLATGKAVGAYAELLERLGYNLDDFNAVLEKGELPADDIEAALAVLDAKDITDTYKEYKKNNAELIKELETIARLEMASARIGEIVSRNITTPIKSSFADTLEWLANEMQNFERDPEGYVANVLSKGIEATVDILTNGIESQAGEMIGTVAKDTAKSVARKGTKTLAMAFGADEETQENISEIAESYVENVAQGIGGGAKWINNTLNPLKIMKNISDVSAGKITLEEAIKNYNPLDEQYTGAKENSTSLKRGEGLWVPDEASKAFMRSLSENVGGNGKSGIHYSADGTRMGGQGLKIPDTAQKWESAYNWIKSTFAAGEYDMPVGQWKTVAFNRATDAQLAVRNAVDNLFANWVSPEKAEEAGEEAATSFLDGWETMVMRPDLAQEAEGFLTDEQGNAIKPIGIRENWEEYLKTITDMVPQYEEAGEEAGAATAKAFGAELDAAAAQAKLAGATAALNFGAGLSSQVSYVAAQAGVLAAAASARLSSSRGGGTVNVALNIDGRQVATALAPYNDEVMAVTFGGTTPFQMR